MWYVWLSFILSQALLAWFVVIPLGVEVFGALVKTCSVIRWSLAKYRSRGEKITLPIRSRVIVWGFRVWFFTFFGSNITKIGDGDSGGLWYGVGDWTVWHNDTVIGKSKTLDRNNSRLEKDDE